MIKIRAPEQAAPDCGWWGRRWGRGGHHGHHGRRGHGHHGHHGHEDGTDSSRSESPQSLRGHWGHGHFGRGRGRHGFGGRGGWARWHPLAAMFAGGAQCPNWRGENTSEKLRARLVENVTIPERSVVGPSQSLVKTWKVTNPGPAGWPESTKLIFVRGDRSVSSEEEFPVPPCKAGETVDINALVITPATNGRHTAVFRLADADRIPFGPRFWCDFVVGDPSSLPKMSESGLPKTETKSDVRSDVKSDVAFGDQAPAPASTSAPTAPTDPTDPTDPRKEKYAVQLRALSGMGFTDEDLNLNLLEVNEGNVQTVCETLLNSMR